MHNEVNTDSPFQSKLLYSSAAAAPLKKRKDTEERSMRSSSRAAVSHSITGGIERKVIPAFPFLVFFFFLVIVLFLKQ